MFNIPKQITPMSGAPAMPTIGLDKPLGGFGKEPAEPKMPDQPVGIGSMGVDHEFSKTPYRFAWGNSA